MGVIKKSVILLGWLVLFALSSLIWLIENTDLLIQVCQLQELLTGFIDPYPYIADRGTWDGAGKGEEAASCFGELSPWTWKEGRQERRQQEQSCSSHFILTKSFLLALESCQQLIIRINEHVQKH